MLGAGRLTVLAAGAVMSWAITPWVAMVARGTVDSRHRDAVRRLGADVAAPGRTGPMPAAWDTVPGQSRAGGPTARPTGVPAGPQDAAPHPGR